MADQQKTKLRLEIVHVLFIDVVGYSKLLIDEQSEALGVLNRIVRNTEAAREAEAAGQLTILPTGDGMALVFTGSVEDPVECALQVSQALRAQAILPVRMGIHSGPVNKIFDVNDRSNLAGGGINIAQRVMDCGDAGHILLSKRVAEDLEQHSKWRRHLHYLGTFEVKHGVKIDVFNLYTPEVGNPALPKTLKNKKVKATVPLVQFAKGLAASVLLAGIAFVGIWFFLHRGDEGSPGLPLATVFPDKRIAVLPFKPLVARDRDEVLEAGMADTLITKLSNSREIMIPAISMARKCEEEKKDSVRAGRALGVSSVLEGNVQKSGDRIRVTARLIKVADGSSMWAGTFDEKFTDVFQVQDAIAQKVAAALELRLNENEQKRLTKRYTKDTEAYQLYLKGRFYWNKFTEEGWRKSIEFYKQAAEKDPNYALAYSGIADSYSLLGELGIVPPKEFFPQARAYAEKALQLDDSLSEAHLSLGIVKLFYDWDPAAAEPELRQARELNPNDPQVHHFYGHYLEFAGRYQEAAIELKRGVDLDPTNLIVNSEYAWAHYIQHKDDEAIVLYKKTLELDPNFLLASVWLAQAYEQKGMYAEAMAELERAHKIDNWSWIVAEIGCVDALLGKRDDAQAVITALTARAGHEYIDETLIVYILIALGERDQAFDWMEKGYRSRAGNLPWMIMEPKFDPLRSDPRFTELASRMGLK